MGYQIYKDKVLFESNVAYQHSIGKKIAFYQAANIGGNYGLRGFRNQRFTGERALTISNDLKWHVKDLKSDILPLQFGLLGGVDLGRVWNKNEQSSIIHTSYGSGFWLQSGNLVKGSLIAFGSDEGLRFSFNLYFGIN